MTDANPYAVLGVSPQATPDQIQAAYRAKVKTAHPDHPGGSNAAFLRVKAARDALSSQTRTLPTVPPPHRPVALAVFLSLLYALLAVILFRLGDRPVDYNGGLVIAGWTAAILAWRTWSDRKIGLRDPITSLLQGAAILLLSLLLLLWRLIGVGLVLFLILGAFTISEKIIG